jgi:hypothetical protein
VIEVGDTITWKPGFDGGAVGAPSATVDEMSFAGS